MFRRISNLEQSKLPKAVVITLLFDKINSWSFIAWNPSQILQWIQGRCLTIFWYPDHLLHSWGIGSFRKFFSMKYNTTKHPIKTKPVLFPKICICSCPVNVETLGEINTPLKVFNTWLIKLCLARQAWMGH